MSESPLKVLVVIGSLGKESAVKTVLKEVARQIESAGCEVDLLDLTAEPLGLFNPETAFADPSFPRLKERVEQSDVYLLGSPDYHGSMSGALKTFLDHFWHEFAGKLFAILVASGEKGLTVMDQLRTVARQCQAWTLPYGVSFSEPEDVREGRVASERLKNWLDMLARDLRVYGQLLARQRADDLRNSEPGFMARHRRQA